MTNIGAGEIIYDLRKKIQQLQFDLEQLGEPAKNIPEMIESANLLRSNEYLLKSDEKKTELIGAYGQYSKELEELLSTVFDIQKDLKDILKEQSTLISNSSKKSKPKKKLSNPKKK
ncbi:MAG: hypothetical protein ACW9W4_09575 [Candidatus Nitrosopumilus sp. bin_7KS]